MVTQRLGRFCPSKGLLQPGVKANANAINTSGRRKAQKVLPFGVGLCKNVRFTNTQRQFLDDGTLLGCQHLLVAIVGFLAADSHEARLAVFDDLHVGKARHALLCWMRLLVRRRGGCARADEVGPARELLLASAGKIADLTILFLPLPPGRER